MGHVPARAPVGHGARGLLGRRRGLGLPAVRPRRPARVPLGRRRAARASATTAGSSASASPSGTAPIRSSRSGSSASRATEGNHGEDVKELYWYLDATPTCSYARALYKYPQTAFPYEELRARSRSASKADPEPELLDTAAFADNRYFDVVVEYAKAEVERRPRPHHGDQPRAARRPDRGAPAAVVSQHVELDARHRSPADAGARGRCPTCRSSRRRRRTWGPFWLHVEGADELLFTENESNARRLWGVANAGPLREGRVPRGHRQWPAGTPSRRRAGRRSARASRRTLEAGQSMTVRLRYADRACGALAFADHDAVFARRIAEADEFYDAITPVAPQSRRAADLPPVDRRAALEQAILCLRRRAVAARRPRAARAAARALGGA